MKMLMGILMFSCIVCSSDVFPGEEGHIVATNVEEQIRVAIENGAPTEISGVEGGGAESINLEAYADSLVGGTFRARELTLLPGGKIGVHDHNHRPAFVYVLEGEFLEHRSDTDEPVVRQAGDMFFESPGLVHWSENASDQPARAIAVDILPADSE